MEIKFKNGNIYFTVMVMYILWNFDFITYFFDIFDHVLDKFNFLYDAK